MSNKLASLQREIEMVQAANRREEDEKKRLGEQYAMLQKSLENTD